MGIRPDGTLQCVSVTDSPEGLRVLRMHDRWLEPRHLVSVAAAAHFWRARGVPVHLAAPAAPDRARYAARMHVGAAVAAAGASHDLPAVRARDLRSRLLEVTSLRTADDARRLGQLVHDRLEAQDPEAAHGMYEALVEVGMNVQDHSGSSGYAAAQVMPGTGEVLFAVADAGVGLQATLKHQGAVDDRAALELALAGTSRFDEPDRGRGLPATLQVLSTLAGSLYVATGDASVEASSTDRRHGLLLEHCIGTVLQGRIRPLRPQAFAACPVAP